MTPPPTLTLTAPTKPSPPTSSAPATGPARFTFFPHQRDQIVRAAMADGAILGWDPGLGKTFAAYALPILKRSRLVLLVAPEDLHDQMVDCGRRFFGVHTTRIRSIADYHALVERGTLPRNHTPDDPASEDASSTPRFFITDYFALGLNGGDTARDGNVPKTSQAERVKAFKSWSLRHAPEHLRTPGPVSDEIAAERHALFAAMHDNIGESHPSSRIQCVLRPTLSHYIPHTFDTVICDEGVRLKSGTNYIASGVIRLRPRFRYILTGTPIKNNLQDFFWLAHWVSGGHARASARFPYDGTSEACNQFASDHLVFEENITKQMQSEQDGQMRRYRKRSNDITNIHRLWKLIGPLVLRCRKDELEHDIVPKTIVPLRVMPGAAQQRTYQHHLRHPPVKKTRLGTLGAQLQLLRQSALGTGTTPKMLALLKLAGDLYDRGEQLVIASPFTAFSAAITARLREAGIPTVRMDGSVSPKRRAALAADFKARRYAVAIIGIGSMSEGHSFECCSHLAIASLEWAYDKNRQVIDRVHRITSRKEVTIYLCITRNTIDERLASVFQTKGDSSDLALDGRLFEEEKEQFDIGTLLRDAVDDFDPDAKTLDEEHLDAHWRRELLPGYRRLPAWPTPDTPAPKTKAPKTKTPAPAANVLPIFAAVQSAPAPDPHANIPADFLSLLA